MASWLYIVAEDSYDLFWLNEILLKVLPKQKHTSHVDYPCNGRNLLSDIVYQTVAVEIHLCKHLAWLQDISCT